jgi:hypothetical protein
MNNRSKRHKQLENAVEQFAKLHKLEYRKTENYRCFKCGQVQNRKAKGFPDFLFFYPFILALEVKTGSGRLTKEQKDFKLKWEHNADYLLLRDTIDDFVKYVDDWRWKCRKADLKKI